eukprot:gene8285-10180_t
MASSRLPPPILVSNHSISQFLPMSPQQQQQDQQPQSSSTTSNKESSPLQQPDFLQSSTASTSSETSNITNNSSLNVNNNTTITTTTTATTNNQSEMAAQEKIEKLKDITSKTIDMILSKINEMKREKQFKLEFKEIVTISETLLEMEKMLESVELNNPSSPNNPLNSTTATPTSTSQLPTTPSSSNIENELIKLLHSKSNLNLKRGSSRIVQGKERSTNSIESLYSIIHQCLDEIKLKLLTMKKHLVFEESFQVCIAYGSVIRNIRNSLNKFRTISLPEDLEIVDGEKLLLNIQSCNYHLFDNSISNSSSDKEKEKDKMNQQIFNEEEFVNGSLFITNFQIIFIGTFQNSTFIKSFSLHSIIKYSKSGKKKSPGDFSKRLYFTCKDFRTHILSFNKNTTNLKDVKSCLENQLNQSPSTLFCYNYRSEYIDTDKMNLGWHIYDEREEYARMGVPSPDWRFCHSNNSYFLCESYPPILVVPEAVTDEHIKGSAQFRSKGRIPVLAYRHWQNKCSITRCSQPLVGISRSRSEEDEFLLNAIRLTSTASSASSSTGSLGNSINNNGKDGKLERTLYILDARPYANAVGNIAKGAGWEIISNYPHCEIEFLGIANIHAMRSSLWKIKDAAMSSCGKEDNWFSILESSEWFDHIKLLLLGASRIAKLVHLQHSNVLVHCSDGWDRCSQLVSLGEILLDPYFRTIRGFQVLIEKEWLSFGHKFAHRCGQVNGKEDDERSPIFYQFLETVYQILSQFPSKFEFNAHFLRKILYHVYSGQYGNFLQNTEKERVQSHISGKTISLWAAIDTNIKDYLNPLYIPPSGNQDKDVLFPDCSLKKMKVWKQIYFSISDTEFYDPEEKLVRQFLDKQLEEKATLFKQQYPLKPQRAHTASISVKRNPSSNLPSFHISSTSNGGGSSSGKSSTVNSKSIYDLDNNLIDPSSTSSTPIKSGSKSTKSPKSKDGYHSVGKSSFFNRKESSKKI